MTVPKIRFKGFEGDWQKCNLGDVTSIRGGYAFQSSQFQKQGIPIVRISNLLQDGNVGGEYAYYPKIDGDSNVTLHAGDVVIAMSGATTGKIARVKNHEGTLYQNQRVGLFVRTNKVDYNYLYSIVNSIRFSESLNKLLTSSAQPNASSSDIESVEMCFPINREEQEYLGEYIRFFDSLIQCTAKKITSLKQTKQACLQSMFPQLGETTPRIRFKGFEGDWEKKTIRDICYHQSSSLTQNSLDKKHGSYPVFGASGFIQNINSYDQAEPYIGVIKDGSGVGRVGLYPAFSSLLGTMQYLRVNEVMDIGFLYALLQTKDLSMFITGSTIPHIYFKDYAELEIFVPSREEQRQIASFFSNIDKQTTLQEQQLEKLKQIKVACLDNMFV